MNSANRTIKYLNNSVEGVAVMAVSHDWNSIRSFDLENGRYFTEQEVEGAKNYVILGHSIALSLFNKLDNIGKVIKIKIEKAIVIGVFSKRG